MTGKAALELALAYLTGRVDRSKAVAKTSFKLPPHEVDAARQAIATLLSQPRPPRELLDALSALFDPVDSLRSKRRKLVLIGRGKGAPRDTARDIDLIVEIKRTYLVSGVSLADAIADVAERTGRSEGGLWEVWNRNPYLREEILS